MQYFWTGGTPRRSSRLSEQLKATETPESEPPRKRQNGSRSKKGPKDKREGDEEEAKAFEEKEDAAVQEETKTVEVEMEEADDMGAKGQKEVSAEDTAIVISDKELEPKAEEKDVGKEELDIEKTENEGAGNETTSDAKEEHIGSALLATPGFGGNEDGGKQTKGAEAPPEVENKSVEANNGREKKPIEPKAPTEAEKEGLEGGKEGKEKHLKEPEAPSKVENEKADDEVTISDSQKRVERISQLASGLEDGEEKAEKQCKVAEVPS